MHKKQSKKFDFKQIFTSIRDYLKNNKKRALTILLILAIIIVIGFVAKKTIFKSEAKYIYDVVVTAKENKINKGSGVLKVGDVLLTRKVGPVFGDGEKRTYLILQMELTENQAQKLTMAKEEDLSEEEIEKKLNEYKENIGEVSEEDLNRYKEELEHQKNTLAPRIYRIDIEDKLKDFDASDLRYGQPYDGEVFTWKIVEKRK